MQQRNTARQASPNPWPPRGLSSEDFVRLGQNGLGDPLNAYPHSMELYKDRLYVGTSRGNLCMLKVSKIRTSIKYWPVECPDDLYDLDMRAQIRAFDFQSGDWDEMFRSPMI